MPVGDPVESPIAPPPVQGKDEQAERVRRAKALAAKYRTELPVSGTLFRGRVTRSRQCRTNAEFVKLNAPVLLRSAPKLLPLARRSAQH
jgi:hypothetical protein